MTNAAYQVECVARLKQHTIKPIAAKAMKKLTGTACAGAGVNTGNSWLDVNTVQKRSAFATTNLPPGKLVFHKYRANKCEQFVFFCSLVDQEGIRSARFVQKLWDPFLRPCTVCQNGFKIFQKIRTLNFVTSRCHRQVSQL